MIDSRILEAATDGDELVTAEEVAAIFRVEVRTVYGWRARGTGPKSIKAGGFLRYRLSEVKRVLAETERVS